jgi:ATP adenylyltransferase
LAYIKSEKTPAEDSAKPLALPPGADPDCFLCQAAADPETPERHVVQCGPTTLTVLNRYPYNNGHLLVAPIAHCGRIDELSDQQHLEVAHRLSQMIGLLEKHLGAEGFNVGVNLGRVAGAGLPGHLHWHIVPRWSGDTNYMPVLASVKVIPQSLEELRQLLREALNNANQDSPA